jgi:hypothetical protein
VPRAPSAGGRKGADTTLSHRHNLISLLILFNLKIRYKKAAFPQFRQPGYLLFPERPVAFHPRLAAGLAFAVSISFLIG